MGGTRKECIIDLCLIEKRESPGDKRSRIRMRSDISGEFTHFQLVVVGGVGAKRGKENYLEVKRKKGSKENKALRGIC